MVPFLLCESQRTLRLFTLRIEGCVIFSLLRQIEQAQMASGKRPQGLLE
jgi:hypothetical protein